MKVLKPTTIPFPSNGRFIRNSTATYIEDDVIKTAGVNVPRWQDGKLLLEGEATNLFLQSQTFSDAVWLKGNVTFSSTTVVAPDGVSFGYKLSESATTSTAHLSGQLFATAVNQDYVFSFYAKAAERTSIAVESVDKDNIFHYHYIDLVSGAVDSPAGAPPCVVAAAPMGWWRVCVTRNSSSGASTNYRFNIILSEGKNLVYAGTVGSGVYIWGAQIEKGSVASSYIPTTTAPVTREADVCIGNFSRASIGTYVDNNGVLQTAGVNVPRIQNGRLLMEGQATNFVWPAKMAEGLNNCTGVFVSGVLPDGMTSNTIFRVSPSAGANVRIGDTLSGMSGTLYSGSVYARSVDGGTYSWSVDINDSIPHIFEVGPQWVRMSASHTRLGVPYRFMDLFPTNESTAQVEFCFPQITEGGLSSYIPTTTGPATRAADVCTAGLVYTNATDVRPLWSSATTYSVGQIIRHNNTIYESLQSTNLNHQPDTSPTWWLSLGADNISAAFDGKVGSKTTAVDKLRMIVYPGSVIDAVGYLETNASVVNTSALDVNGNLAYSNSTGFTEANIENWYDYFFVSPLADPATQVVHQGIPSLDPSLFIGIEMINPGTVEVGSVLTGYSTTIGKTQYGLKAGIVDYSKKESDEFGNVSIVERPYSKRMQGDVYVQNYDLNKVQRFLYNIRATPVLWMASDNPELAEVSYVYGFYKDFSTTISYPDVSMCNLDIEGLI